MSNFILLEHLQVEYANSIAGGLTYGFPSVGSFVGFIENVNRKINESTDLGIDLNKVIILAHKVDNLIYQESPFKTASFCQKGTDLAIIAVKQGTFERPALIEEGYLHADLSLLIPVVQLTRENLTTLEDHINKAVSSCKLAGGFISSFKYSYIEESEIANKLYTLYYSTPFATLSAESDEFMNFCNNNDCTRKIDALLKLSSITYKCEQNGEVVKWKNIIQKAPFTMPLHIGYKAISSELTASKNIKLRKPEYPAVLVESVFSFGKWIVSVKELINEINNDSSKIFWEYVENDNFYIFNRTYVSLDNSDTTNNTDSTEYDFYI